MVRLDKYLCDAGIGTRSGVKEMIKKGRVTVDGEVCKNPRSEERRVGKECGS